MNIDYVLINSLHDLTIAWEDKHVDNDFYIACVKTIRDHTTLDYVRDELTEWLVDCDSLLTDRCESWMIHINPNEIDRMG